LFTKMPIARRLFLTFLLAVLIPNVMIVVVSGVSFHTLLINGITTAQIGPLLLVAVIAFLASTSFVVFLGYVMNNSITRPLLHLVAVTHSITRGELQTRAKMAGRDEISIVAASMNSMLDTIVKLKQEAEEQRNQLQAQIEQLIAEVSGVGEGDLRVQAVVTPSDLGVLADSFNYMVEELAGLVIRVKQVALEVERETVSNVNRMKHLFSLAQEQIRSIEQASKEIEEMAHSSQQVMQLAQTLNEATSRASLAAHSGREMVQQAIVGIRRSHANVQGTAHHVQLLDEYSKEIGAIVEVTTTIAVQTNRLALDAAIQAAMAGEHGKGFGAVAQDIRRLAEKEKEQTTTITRIVRRVQEGIRTVAISMKETERETEEGARLVEQTGKIFEEIFAGIEEQVPNTTNINQWAEQQFHASHTIVATMQETSATTKQSSTTTQEVADHLQHLTRLLEELLASVAVFQVREQSGSTLRFEKAHGRKPVLVPLQATSPLGMENEAFTEK